MKEQLEYARFIQDFKNPAVFTDENMVEKIADFQFFVKIVHIHVVFYVFVPFYRLLINCSVCTDGNGETILDTGEW